MCGVCDSTKCNRTSSVKVLFYPEIFQNFQGVRDYAKQHKHLHGMFRGNLQYQKTKNAGKGEHIMFSWSDRTHSRVGPLISASGSLSHQTQGLRGSQESLSLYFFFSCKCAQQLNPKAWPTHWHFLGHQNTCLAVLALHLALGNAKITLMVVFAVSGLLHLHVYVGVKTVAFPFRSFSACSTSPAAMLDSGLRPHSLLL